MSEACSAGSDSGSTRRSAAAFWAAEWLSLAAAPTFAIMALQTGVLGGGPAEMLCSAADSWPLSGMVPMYWLCRKQFVSEFRLPWPKSQDGGRGVQGQAF
jgi:hypothetical protein